MATSLGWTPNEYLDNHPHEYAYKTCKVGQDRSRTFWIKLKLFCKTTHNILKYRGTLPWMSPFINIGGTCPSCPIGIDAPATASSQHRPAQRWQRKSPVSSCLYWTTATLSHSSVLRRAAFLVCTARDVFWTVTVRGENPVTPRAQFSFPVAGGQHAAVHGGAPAFRRRRPPVERRPGFKSRTTDQRATRTDWHPIMHLCGPAPTLPLIRAGSTD